MPLKGGPVISSCLWVRRGGSSHSHRYSGKSHPVGVPAPVVRGCENIHMICISNAITRFTKCRLKKWGGEIVRFYTCNQICPFYDNVANNLHCRGIFSNLPPETFALIWGGGIKRNATDLKFYTIVCVKIFQFYYESSFLFY